MTKRQVCYLIYLANKNNYRNANKQISSNLFNRYSFIAMTYKSAIHNHFFTEGHKFMTGPHISKEQLNTVGNFQITCF